MGQLAYARIDYAKAYEYYRDAAKLEPENPTYLNMAGRIAQEVGRYAEARPFLEEALAIREKALGPDHPDVAAEPQQPGGALPRPGPYPKAEPLFQRALTIREKPREGPSRRGHSFNNLASLYQAQGHYAKAEPLYQRSLEIREKALGKDHPDVARASTTWRRCTRPWASTPRPSRSTSEAGDPEKALGTDHPDVATGLDNLAAL